MAAVESLTATAASFPTGERESDGTLEWDSTGVVVVELEAGGDAGLGWTYGAPAAAAVIEENLAPALQDVDADDVPAAWMAMRRAIRNSGDVGIGALALSAVDIALWDRFSRRLGVPLAVALGMYRDAIDVYGSGGFCSLSLERLAEQLGGWAEAGIEMVKLKVGRDPEADPERVRIAREAIGPDTRLFADANGAWSPREAIERAHTLDRAGSLSWLEEPVSSRDHRGLRFVREHAPAHVAVAAGEYAWGPEHARSLIAGGAVDVLQLDATRCLGLTGFRAAAAMTAAYEVPVSAHCSPAIHLHACCAAESAVHLEYFHDHVRVENELFHGTPEPQAGRLSVDRKRSGHGLQLRRDVLRAHAPRC